MRACVECGGGESRGCFVRSAFGRLGTATGLAAGAAKAGARLSGDTNDLLKAARALRAAASEEGADFGRVLATARDSYRGLDEALNIRVGSRARVSSAWRRRPMRLRRQRSARRSAWPRR